MERDIKVHIKQNLECEVKHVTFFWKLSFKVSNTTDCLQTNTGHDVSSVCLQPLQVSPEVTFVSSVTVCWPRAQLSLLCVPLCVCLSMIVCFLFDVCYILFCCCFCWVLLTQLLPGWLILILTLLIKGLFFQVISICPSAGETASGQHAG